MNYEKTKQCKVDEALGQKVCSKCANALPLSDYVLRKNTVNKGGKTYYYEFYNAHCRTCESLRKKTPPKNRQKRLNQTREEYLASSMARGHARKFGLTTAQVLDIYSWGCEACGEPLGELADGRSNIVIDHDHTTGKVRGGLCNRCNLALGLLDDNPLKIAELMNYISRHVH